MGLNKVFERRGVTKHEEVLDLIVDKLFPAYKIKDSSMSEVALRNIAMKLMLDGYVIVANAHSQLWHHTAEYVKITSCEHAKGAYTHTLDKKFYRSEFFKSTMEEVSGTMKAHIDKLASERQTINGLYRSIDNDFELI